MCQLHEVVRKLGGVIVTYKRMFVIAILDTFTVVLLFDFESLSKWKTFERMGGSADVLWLGLSTSRRPTTSRFAQTSWTDPTFFIFFIFKKNIYLLYLIICTDSQHEMYMRSSVILRLVLSDAPENRELVLVGFDWQLEKFKSPFEAEEPHGWSP